MLSRKARRVANAAAGLQTIRSWQAAYHLSNGLGGMETLGQYWANASLWLIDHDIVVVLVNRATMKSHKERRDNS